MTWLSDLVYRSQNGDAWHLLRDTGTARILVRHAANPASGGRVTDLPMEEFLAIDGPGPEHRALCELLAGLARSPSAGHQTAGPADNSPRIDRSTSSLPPSTT